MHKLCVGLGVRNSFSAVGGRGQPGGKAGELVPVDGIVA